MLVSLNWLKRYAEFNMSVDKISDALTMLGLEVEGVKKLGMDTQGVVSAEVISCEKHPKADKLKVCQVFDGKQGSDEGLRE